MSEATNRIAQKLASLGKREAAALRITNEGVALRKLAAVAAERCIFLRGLAEQNAEFFGLSEETMALVVAPKDDEE